MWILVPLLVVVLIAVEVVGAYLASSIIHSTVYYWFPFPFFPLILIPFLFLFFFGFRWFFWGNWGRGCYFGHHNDPALTVLRERYAKGEITKEQLEQMTRDLE